MVIRSEPHLGLTGGNKIVKEKNEIDFFFNNFNDTLHMFYEQVNINNEQNDCTFLKYTIK